MYWPHPIVSGQKSTGKKGNSDNGSEHNNNDNLDEGAYPSPRSMANLGLYFSPESEFKDQCTVYPDGHIISAWKEGQTALDRLTEEDATISWVMIETSRRASEEKREGENYVWNQKDDRLMPRSKAMVDARLRTFGGAWPLDGKKGWKPTSKKVSVE